MRFRSLWIIVVFFVSTSIVGCNGQPPVQITLPDTYIMATTAYSQSLPHIETIPGEYRVFQSQDRVTWTRVSINFPSDSPATEYTPRREIRPGAWAAVDTANPIKFVVCFWDMLLPGNPTGRSTEAYLVVATLSQDFHWTGDAFDPTGHAFLPRDLGNLHRTAFSPAVAAIGNNYLVAWGDVPVAPPATSFPVKVARFQFERFDPPVADPLNNPARFKPRLVGSVIDTPFTTTKAVTLTVQNNRFVLGFSQGNRLMIATSDTGEAWPDPPVDTNIPATIQDNTIQVHPLADPWGNSLTAGALDGPLMLGTVAQTFPGPGAQGPDRLMLYTSSGGSLTNWTLDHVIPDLPQGAQGYSAVGAQSELLEAYLDVQLVARAGPRVVAMPAPTDAQGNPLVYTPPVVAFGRGVP
jgi:hypothetical protein